MSHAGDFSEDARAAIYEAAGWRCVGCGASSPMTCQHRIARGMGGTSNALIGHPSNGVALCGSGTTGDHGWAESHPLAAELLGWRVNRHEDPVERPWWTKYGWRKWMPDLTVVSVNPDALDRAEDRASVVSAFCSMRGIVLVS